MSTEFIIVIVAVGIVFIGLPTLLEYFPEWTTQHKDKPQNHRQHKA